MTHRLPQTPVKLGERLVTSGFPRDEGSRDGSAGRLRGGTAQPFGINLVPRCQARPAPAAAGPYRRQGHPIRTRRARAGSARIVVRAPDRHHDPRTRHRPGVPAAQEPGPGSGVASCRSGRRTSSTPRQPSAVYCRAAARGGPGRPGARARGPAGKDSPRPVRERPALRRLEHARGRDVAGLQDRDDRSLRGRPELAAAEIPLEIHIPVLPCRGGADLRAGCFEPLGWQLTAVPIVLDAAFPAWGTRATSTCGCLATAAGRRAEPSVRAAAGA